MKNQKRERNERVKKGQEGKDKRKVEMGAARAWGTKNAKRANLMHRDQQEQNKTESTHT